MSLHPIKSKQKHHRSRGYARLRVEHGWETGEKKNWTPGKWTKRGILSSLVLLGILTGSFAFYQVQVAPYQPGGSEYRIPDPFTPIWNGTLQGTAAGTPLVAANNFTDGNSCTTCTIVLTLTKGYWLMLAVQFSGAGSTWTPSVSDSLVNTFTQDLYIAPGASINWQGFVYHAPVTVGGKDTVTVSTNGGGALQQLQLVEYTGVSAIGNKASAAASLAPTTLNSSLTINTSAGSDIFEAFSYLNSGGLDCSCPFSLGNVQNTQSLIHAAKVASSAGAEALTAHVAPAQGGSNTLSAVVSGLGNNPIYYIHGIIELKTSSLGCPPGYKCLNSKETGNRDLELDANATFPGVMLTNSSIDLSSVASKDILFFQTWKNTTNLNGQGFGWYLTLNGTLPNTSAYSPLNDGSVFMVGVTYWSSGTAHTYVYLQRTHGQLLLASTGLGRDPFPNCPQTSSLYICQSTSLSAGSQFISLSAALNFTASTNNANPNEGVSMLCANGTPSTLLFCEASAILGLGKTPCASAAFCGTSTLPFIDLSNTFYLGFWSETGQTGSINFGSTNSGTFAERANAIYYWVPTPTTQTPAQTDTGGFFGWLGRSLGGAWNAVSGFIAPIAGPVLGLGNSLLSVFISGLIQAGNLLIQGMTVLESVLVTVLNAIGNFLGFGNIGSNVQSLINSLVSFFTNGTFTNSFAFLSTGFTLLFNSGTIIVSWFNVAISFVTGALTFAANGIGFVGTAAYWFFLGWSALYGTMFIILWFIDLGDYGAQGGLIWFDTMRWLFFGTGIGFLIKIINLGLDMITYLVGLIPKPIVQMVAHAIPRIPIIEASGSPTFPDGHMEAARNGNVFTVLGWMIGFFFTVAYEGTNLPGSIGAFVPGAFASTSLLTNTLPLFEIMLFMGGLTLVFILPAKLANFMPGLFEQSLPGKNLPVSLRASAPARGPTHVGIRKAEKRFQGRLEKKLVGRQMARAEFKKRLAEGRGLEKP